MNILDQHLSADALAEVFARHPPRPLLPPMGDPEWSRVRANPLLRGWIGQVRDRALAELDQPMPALSDALYVVFHHTGDRLPFELPYLERRRQLARAVMASLLEADSATRQVLLESVTAKASDIFAETSWSIPAHVSHPSGKDPMRIDLFAAETANLFGELLDLFPGVFSDGFVSAVKGRLHAQFFENFLNNSHNWTTNTSNWNAVCHQGVSGAALAVVDDPVLLGRIFERVAAGLRIFLSGFTPDGGSSEGPGYWGYGFGWMAQLNRQLERRTVGELSVFENSEKILDIANFGPRMMLSNGFCVNFSDNSYRASPRPSLLQYLGDRLDDAWIKSHAVVGWKQMLSAPLPLDEQRMDVFAMTRLFLLCPSELPAAAELPVGHTVLPSLGVGVVRFRDSNAHLWEFACKGGHNAEHHNHNDIGSYLLNIDGCRMLIEVGSPEYVRAFFSKARYTFLAARSLGHPVPLINGFEQPAGPEFKGQLHGKLRLAGRGALEEGEYDIDLTHAYPKEAGCSRCARSIWLEQESGRIRIVDSFVLEKVESLETAIITLSPVTVADGVAAITVGGLTLRIVPKGETQIREVQTLSFNDHGGMPTPVYRIVIGPRKLTRNARLEYGFELAE